MSTSRSSSTAPEAESSASGVSRSAQQLRKLAPKPPDEPSRPAFQRSRTATSVRGSSRRNHLACSVCGQISCQLLTHRAFTIRTRSTASSSAESADPRGAVKSLLETSYTKSYGYLHAQQYVDQDIAASRIDPFFDLPILDNGNMPEMHRLFHDYFVVQCERAINVARPPEMASELVYSPFFVPAMFDTALCLSILACSAASIPSRTGQSSNNVTAYTLVGQAMQALRDKLNATPEYVEDSTIVAATFLWGVNSLVADPATMKTHAKSVYALVEARGGLAKLGLAGAVAGLIRWIDILNALLCAERCFFQDLTDPGPLEWPPKRTYGAFFQSQRAAAILQQDVRESCLETCKNIEAAEFASDFGITGKQYTHLLTKFCFLAARRASLEVEHSRTGTMSECVSFADQIINTLIFFAAREQRMLMVDQATRLVQAIRQTGGRSFWAEDLELLTWILFVITIIPHEFGDKDWCVDLLEHVLIARFGEGDWPERWQDQVQEELKQIIWSKTRLSEPFHKICRSLGQSPSPEEEE